MKQEVFGVMRKMGCAESRSFPIDSAAGSFQTHQGHRNAANAPKPGRQATRPTPKTTPAMLPQASKSRSRLSAYSPQSRTVSRAVAAMNATVNSTGLQGRVFCHLDFLPGRSCPKVQVADLMPLVLPCRFYLRHDQSEDVPGSTPP